MGCIIGINETYNQYKAINEVTTEQNFSKEVKNLLTNNKRLFKQTI